MFSKAERLSTKLHSSGSIGDSLIGVSGVLHLSTISPASLHEVLGPLEITILRTALSGETV